MNDQIAACFSRNGLNAKARRRRACFDAALFKIVGDQWRENTGDYHNPTC